MNKEKDYIDFPESLCNPLEVTPDSLMDPLGDMNTLGDFSLKH